MSIQTLNVPRSNLKNITASVLAVILMLLPLYATAQPYGLRPDYEMEQGLQNYQEKMIVVQLRLAGITTYEASEIFHQLLSRTSGVIEVERYFSRIIPRNPHACLVTWRVVTDGIDGFELESRLYRRLLDYLDNDGDSTELPLPFTVLERDIEQLKDILPFSSAAKQIIFSTNWGDVTVGNEYFNSLNSSPYNWLPNKGFD